MYAVIDLKWHQYIVKEGDQIVVDNMDTESGANVDIENVLLTFDEAGADVKVGNPFLKKVSVSAKVLETKKWEKINVLKFKRKTRYERLYWHRSLQTILEIQKISL